MSQISIVIINNSQSKNKCSCGQETTNLYNVRNVMTLISDNESQNAYI